MLVHNIPSKRVLMITRAMRIADDDAIDKDDDEDTLTTTYRNSYAQQRANIIRNAWAFGPEQSGAHVPRLPMYRGGDGDYSYLARKPT